MGAPGTGVGRAGVWQAGVEVDPTSLIGFSLEATAGLSFAGVVTLFGEFGLVATSVLDFAGVELPTLVGDFGLESTAEIVDFTGVELLPQVGDFGLVAEAETEFGGFSFTDGSFGLEAVASLSDWVGEVEAFGGFSFEGVADIEFAGNPPEASGDFALVGVAEVRMEWVPHLCPGTASVGCDAGIPSVSGRVPPSSACTCFRKDC